MCVGSGLGLRCLRGTAWLRRACLLLLWRVRRRLRRRPAGAGLWLAWHETYTNSAGAQHA